MPIVGFLNSKGGVGKSTLCAAVAVRASKDFPNVCLVDLDPQESIADWWRRRGPGEPDNPRLIEGVTRASDAVKALQHEHCDWVFLDGPPGSLLVTDDAIGISHFVVIPMRPSPLDILASQDAVRLCLDAGRPFAIVFNSCKGGASDKLLNDARATLKQQRVPMTDAAVTQRNSYVTAMTGGKTGPERDAVAAEEIDALWREIKAATLKSMKPRSGGKGKKGSA
jgi:chromosome partitioning protein